MPVSVVLDGAVHVFEVFSGRHKGVMCKGLAGHACLYTSVVLGGCIDKKKSSCGYNELIMSCDCLQLDRTISDLWSSTAPGSPGHIADMVLAAWYSGWTPSGQHGLLRRTTSDAIDAYMQGSSIPSSHLARKSFCACAELKLLQHLPAVCTRSQQLHACMTEM